MTPTRTGGPVLARTRAELHVALADVRGGGGRVGLVPTMGALHEGHLALVRAAREDVGPSGAVVVSIFVNPLQFGPHEDLERYPRTLETDLRLCAAEGVDVVFAPAVDEVYPGGEPVVTVDPGPDTSSLEGRARPGHFRGVLTVVAKLFGLVGPDVALFGEKDYEQLANVRRMVADLCMRVEVVGVPTVREPDGLALSSRNRYLSTEERARALSLHRALRAGADAAADGADAAMAAASAVLSDAPGVDVEYLVLAGPDLDGAPDAGPARLLVAARVGTTRLIDNLPVAVAGSLTG